MVIWNFEDGRLSSPLDIGLQKLYAAHYWMTYDVTNEKAVRLGKIDIWSQSKIS